MNNKKLVVESNFIKEAIRRKLSLEEFLLLLYFDNAFEPIFNMDMILSVLKMDEATIMMAYSSLLQKQIIKVEAIKNEAGKITEKILLDNFYNEILLENQKAEKEKKTEDIYSIFESEMGRTLSPMDYELINAWIESGFSEELVIAALKEAVYNGALSLRYIDKVLYEWKKKGFKTVDEVNSHLKNIEDDAPLYETKVLEFDWLDENR